MQSIYNIIIFCINKLSNTRGASDTCDGAVIKGLSSKMEQLLSGYHPNACKTEQLMMQQHNYVLFQNRQHLPGGEPLLGDGIRRAAFANVK